MVACTDDEDKNVSAEPAGTPPILNITAPADGNTLNHSDAVVFEATVEDNEDLPNEVALSWESDIDGIFSTDGADSSGGVTVSIDSLSAGDHVVTVTATDTDGLFVTDTVSLNLNEPPTTPTVTLEPDPATTDQMLVATVSESVDPEGTDTVTYAYEWFEDGVPSAESSSATFPATATSKHHTYGVQVTASDELFESAYGYAETSVINAEPVLSGPSLSADTAVVGDVLTCTATATDADPADSPTVTYAWSDGSTEPTYTVTVSDAVDSTITCTATADDADGGIATGTASATVANTAPVGDTVTIAPLEGQVGDILTCTATASDADGETPTITYEWTSGATGPEYTIAETDDPGDVITCTATATDAHGLTDTGTATATVINTAPVLDTVAVTPLEGQVGDVLTCTATASDADGETPTITFAWSDGSTGPEYTIAESDDPDSLITCTATATDAHGITATGIETATVLNTDPVMSSVTIGPDPAYNNDTLVCSTTTTDADGGSPSITYEWTGGATGPELPLTSIVAAPGDTIVCTATATDTDGGTDTASASVTIGNRAPTVGAVAITPETPSPTDELSCSASDAGDPDDDSVTLTYAWTIDGSPAGDDSATLSTALSKGEVVTCTVTATDDSDATATASNSVTVANTRPNVSDIVLTPSELYTNDTLSAVATVSDADDDEITVTYAFSVSGDVVQDSESDSLSGVEYFDKGDTVSVIVTADDGEGTDTRSSDTITVLNTPPTASELSITDGPNECADGWTLVEDGDRCFKPTFTRQNYSNAEANCVSLGGHLARISSDADNALAISLMYSSDFSGPYTYTWIGGNRIDTSGAFEWTDGEPFDYTNWYPTEPTASSDERCIELFYPFDSSGRWNDDFCTQLRHSVCQIASTSGLACTIDEGSTDADGDAITYTFDWDVDGESFTDTDTTTYDDDTVPNDAIGVEETWTCEVTPNDGEDEGETASASYITEADSCEKVLAYNTSFESAGGWESPVCAGLGCPYIDDGRFALDANWNHLYSPNIEIADAYSWAIEFDTEGTDWSEFGVWFDTGHPDTAHPAIYWGASDYWFPANQLSFSDGTTTSSSSFDGPPNGETFTYRIESKQYDSSTCVYINDAVVSCAPFSMEPPEQVLLQLNAESAPTGSVYSFSADILECPDDTTS